MTVAVMLVISMPDWNNRLSVTGCWARRPTAASAVTTRKASHERDARTVHASADTRRQVPLDLTSPPDVEDKCAGMNLLRCCGCSCCVAGDLSGLPRAASTEIVPT